MATSLLTRGFAAAAPTLNHFTDGRIARLGPEDRLLTWQLNWPFLLGSAPLREQATLIVYNVEREARRHRRSFHPVNRAFPAVEGWNLQGLEWLDRVSLDAKLAFVSYRDLEWFHAHGLQARAMEYIGWVASQPENEVNAARSALDPGHGFSEHAPLLFVGAGGNLDNWTALDWFLQHVAAQVPERRILVVGAGWDAYPRRHHQVEWTGPVQSLASLLTPGSVAINPDQSGAGVKTKLLDAIAMGLPVISTRLGVQGLPPDARRHLWIADEPDAWARLIKGGAGPGAWFGYREHLLALAPEHTTLEATAQRLTSLLR